VNCEVNQDYGLAEARAKQKRTKKEVMHKTHNGQPNEE